MSSLALCQVGPTAARSPRSRPCGAAAVQRSVQQAALQRRSAAAAADRHRLQRRPAAAADRRHLQLVRAAAEQPSVATSSTDEDRVPPGCSRYTVSLNKPLGLVLEEGQGGRGVYVAEVAAGGNAQNFAPEISVGDELVATNGLTFTTERQYQDNIVQGGACRLAAWPCCALHAAAAHPAVVTASLPTPTRSFPPAAGETYVRVNVRNESFKTVMVRCACRGGLGPAACCCVAAPRRPHLGPLLMRDAWPCPQSHTTPPRLHAGRHRLHQAPPEGGSRISALPAVRARPCCPQRRARLAAVASFR